MLRIAQEALTFDDVLLLPAHSDVLPNEVSLKTRLTRNIELNVPLVLAACVCKSCRAERPAAAARLMDGRSWR